MNNQVNEFAPVLGDIKFDHLVGKGGGKEESDGGRVSRGEESEHKQMREDEESSKGLQTCEFLVHLVLVFGINHIKNLKVNYILVFCFAIISAQKS